MTWSRRHTLLLGAALIIATNAVALFGVAYNRSGTPESELRLSQRELRPAFEWRSRKEDSGLSLSLAWRVGNPEAQKRGVFNDYGWGSSPAWLDRAKLLQLGFDLSRPASTPGGRRYYAKLRSKEVFLVLELAGPAYQGSLEGLRELAAKQKAEALAHPEDAKLKRQADQTDKQLSYQEHDASRLFVVDAGLDAEALRAKYPDRTRYAIVRGRVRPTPGRDGAPSGGAVTAVINDSVNVPLDMRNAFAGVQRRSYGFGQAYVGPRFEATVAFGKRFEPWLVGVARSP
jgi:hypothetical protein